MLMFVFFSIFFFFFFLRLLHQKLRYCNCEICHAYLTSSWRNEFDNLCDWYSHLLRRSPTSTIKVHVLNNVVTANPANVEHVLKTRFDNYPKGKQFSDILGDLLGRGIFNSDGDAWRFQRKLSSIELGSVSVRAFAHDIVRDEIETRLVPLLQHFDDDRGDDLDLDLQDVFRRFSFDTISKLSFGLDPVCLRLPLTTSEFAVAFDIASTLSAQRALSPSPIFWKIKRFLNIGSEKKLKQSIDVINRLAGELINQRRKTGLGMDNNDLISRFMAVVGDDDEYLRDIVVSFLLAGRDTVASGLTGVFWLLNRHPEVKNRILEELDRVMGPGLDPVTATFDQMREMNYLHATLYESMRLLPPVQFDSKFALNDDVLADGTFVEIGTRVTYHPYAMARMGRVWGPDCEEFRPERWLDKTGNFRPENPVKYPVFQAGARICIGKDLAIMEMKSVAAAIIRRFEIRVVVTDPISRTPKFAPGLTATMSGGLPVRVRQRRG
ncbi:PREDICTED: cytochrome P450 94C1-like [Tarenaya hassleriana]|uniref:cytochrome P450 94C1-like n=1 Tax=Tarenaya hassleriana TaxID=28532 RepID=UPI00053C88B1|nr:PREDICTED: cytochrome P450 94C1-like [Tarenaya hassleriana]